MASLLTVFLIFVIGLVMIAMFLYIVGIGRIGMQFFKYNFPLTRKRGTFYLIRLRNGRFKWVYDKFKTVWQWPDGSKTWIGKNFDRLAQTTEPMIFLVEGYPTNVMLADQLTKEEMSQLVNNIIKTQETAARLEMELDENKKSKLIAVLPVLTLVFSAMAAIISLAIMLGINDITDALATITTFTKEIQPHIPALVEAIEKLPRNL